MANPEHLANLMKGAEAWNTWRDKHPDVVPDLTGANLQQANLRNVNLSKPSSACCEI